jgi:hypothetical protein
MDADLQMQLKNDSHIENKLLEIAYNLDTNEVWSIDKMLGYNRVFRNFSWNLRECVNFDRASIPTRYHLSSIEFDATCQLEVLYFNCFIIILRETELKTSYFSAVLLQGPCFME